MQRHRPVPTGQLAAGSSLPHGPAGSQIVPEVAEAVPTPTDGGRIYTFTIRSGFRFSPSSNEEVTAQTFKATIERVAARG